MNNEFDLIYEWVLKLKLTLTEFAYGGWVSPQTIRAAQLIQKHLIKGKKNG